MKKIYLLLLVLATVFVACKKDRDVEFSTFTVEDEKIVASYTSMDLSCKVRCAATINEFYLQYDTVADFSTYQEVELVEDEKTEVYSVKIGDLLDNTTYYVRYVAVNSYSQVTSEAVSEFKTLQASVPTIEVREITDLLDTIATVGFVLKFNGGADVTKMGVCWSTDSVPTIEDKYVECSRDAINCVSDGDSLVLNISGLEANTTYYVRAYAENMKGVGYSESLGFVTLTLPVVKTGEITDIQLTSAVLSGEALFNGNDTTTEYGFCWGEEDDLTIEDSQNVNVEVAEDSTFTYRLSNLQDETKYYVRAYAKNKIGIVYGEEKIFKTKSAVVPMVETIEVTKITYTSAKVGGEVISDGGAEVIERGVCYSTKEKPTINDIKIEVGQGYGDFEIELTGLTDGVKYYVRAYAKNKKGIAYGEQVNFMTLEYGLPVVETLEPTDVSYTKARISGKVIADGNLNIIERGICYSTSENPTISSSVVKLGEGLGSFAIELTSLRDGVKYYVRAYAKNSKGVAYGDQMMFTTKELSLPTVEMLDVTEITFTGAKISAKVAEDGGLAVVERGICYSTSQNPTISAHVIKSGDGLGSFILTLDTLTDGITYYVRAYAKNSKGVGYSKEISFKTREYSLPEVKTHSATDITFTSAKVGGEVISDGDTEVIERGICYSTSINPTIENSVVRSGGGLGNFTEELTNLADGITHYVRAYAKNIKGIAYGEQISFKTKEYSLPVVTTMNYAQNLSYTSVEIIGNIVSKGELDLEEVGIDYSEDASFNSYWRSRYYGEKGVGAFIVKLDNLINEKTYYFRAYAKNAKGISHGNVVSFTTLAKYVDLGLSVKWATCNVGAESPEDYGDYFAWGETEPKSYYDWSTYKYCNGDEYHITKYCIIDNKRELELVDDVAYVRWGVDWRMPTQQEKEELVSNCTWTWVIQDGVRGYLVTSNIVGYTDNSIFLPASINGLGEYWTSSSSLGGDRFSYHLYFGENFVNYSSATERKSGQYIRPVKRKKHIIIITSNGYGNVSGDVSGEYLEKTELTITAVPYSGYRFTGWQDGNMDNPRKIIVTSDFTYKAYFEKVSDIKDFVDLGLSSGLKWATCNVGANTPEEYGDYFAWGEVESKNEYTWETYKYCQGTENTLTKYCRESSCGYNGFTDGLNEIDLNDDVVRVRWGGLWRMPTSEEFFELFRECTFEWTSLNGVEGCKLIGPNGNSIFLPAGGRKYYNYYDKSGGHYWSSSLVPSYLDLSYFGDSEAFNESGHYSTVTQRYEGLLIRPVRP